MAVVTTKDKPPAKRHRGRYPKEFRRDVAALVIDQHRSIADVAKELSLVPQTVYLWVRQERVDRGEREGLSTDEREELARLRKEVRQLRQERELLKKATAFWVREPDRSAATAGSTPGGLRVSRSGRRARWPGRHARRTTSGRRAKARAQLRLKRRTW